MSEVLVLASANPDKVAEIAAILGDGVDLRPRPPELPDVVEDADTLEGNARLKAVAVCEAAGTGAVADDTGLEVDALGGAPGCAHGPLRRGGRHLRRQRGQDAHRAGRRAGRRARRPVPDGGPGPLSPTGPRSWPKGWSRATISTEARGDGGFGYDPVFIPADGDGRTFAEMSADEKHAVSHRGRAFRALAAALTDRSGA